MNSGLTALGLGVKPNKNLVEYFKDLDRSISILDFGAGRGRHANALRDLGFNVYGYDPINGDKNADPYSAVTCIKPDGCFDIVFTAFVLNVLNDKEALAVISDAERLTEKRGKTLHIVREDLRRLAGGSVITLKGTYQRDIRISEMINIGYERVGKLFVKRCI